MTTFGDLLARAKTTERNPRMADNTINEVSIAGIHLLKARSGGKLFFIADYKLLDGATGATWDGTKARLDREWADLSALVDAA